MRRRRSGSAERGWCPGHGIAAVGECLTLDSAQVACVPFLVFFFAVFFVLFHCATRRLDERNFALFPPSSGLMF